MDLSHSSVYDGHGQPNIQLRNKMIYGKTRCRNNHLVSPSVTANIVSFTPIGLLADAEYEFFS